MLGQWHQVKHRAGAVYALREDAHLQELFRVQLRGIWSCMPPPVSTSSEAKSQCSTWQEKSWWCYLPPGLVETGLVLFCSARAIKARDEHQHSWRLRQKHWQQQRGQVCGTCTEIASHGDDISIEDTVEGLKLSGAAHVSK